MLAAEGGHKECIKVMMSFEDQAWAADSDSLAALMMGGYGHHPAWSISEEELLVLLWRDGTPTVRCRPGPSS